MLFCLCFFSDICGDDHIASSGALNSPNYPYSYDNNLNCTWTITTTPDSSVFLSFMYFDTESCCDYLKVSIKYQFLNEIKLVLMQVRWLHSYTIAYATMQLSWLTNYAANAAVSFAQLCR